MSRCATLLEGVRHNGEKAGRSVPPLTKEEWLSGTHRELLERREMTVRTRSIYLAGVALAEARGLHESAALFEAKAGEAALALRNIRWALDRVRNGETY